MPDARDLEVAKRILEQQCEPANGKHIDHCFGRMITAWQVKWTDAELSLQRAVWREALGHIPNDLWTQATMHLITHHKFGMPKPAHFMDVIGVQWKARSTKLHRLKAMMGTGRSKPVTQFEREPRDVRLRSMIASGRKHGRMDMAARAERELADVEGRRPEDWALAAERSAQRDGAARIDLPSLPDSPTMQAKLLPGRIRYWTAKLGEGSQLVQDLKRQLAEVHHDAPTDEAIEGGYYEPAADPALSEPPEEELT